MIVPALHLEKHIQLKDLTRFDASKSIAVKGSANPINSVKIKPGADEAEVEVFEASSKNWYLDYAYLTTKYDIDISNSGVSFVKEGTAYSGQVSPGTYDLTSLLTAIETIIETLVSPLNISFSVSDNRVLLTSPIPLEIVRSQASVFNFLGVEKSGVPGKPLEYSPRKVTLKVSSSSEDISISEFINVYSEQGDALFSSDSDLMVEENDIMKWLPQGRSSYKDVHRAAQKDILDWLDRQGYRDDNREKLTKFAFVDNSDVKLWATYIALKRIFRGIRNTTDDVFKKKASEYEALEIATRDRAVLELDLDGDGKSESVPGPAIRSGELFFR